MNRLGGDGLEGRLATVEERRFSAASKTYKIWGFSP